ncbi:hypothetical protein ABZ557_14725 [Streptomyces sp. NPDC019645]|uniref:hypothetical protein n=1 Tax=Streptomyces sp. NPDC019645 TaxID=3154786 RepID=UPI003401FD2D
MTAPPPLSAGPHRAPVPAAHPCERLRHSADPGTFVELEAVDVAIAEAQRSGGLTLTRGLCALAEDAGYG